MLYVGILASMLIFRYFKNEVICTLNIKRDAKFEAEVQMAERQFGWSYSAAVHAVENETYIDEDDKFYELIRIQDKDGNPKWDLQQLGED